MKITSGVYGETIAYTFYKTCTVRTLRPAVLHCVASIFYNFFYRQYHASIFPGLVPVSSVDHPLDKKIPFAPAWVTIYLDFVTFWVRMLAFLLRQFGRASYDAVRGFLESMNRLYAFAAEAYSKNFSTTNRPFYIARPRFLLIHMVDPHLMCVPSLHVMVVILTYTRFAAILRAMKKADIFAAQLDELREGSLAIARAVLFVKQHSVNCISAALYAMTRFDEELFPQVEAEAFAAELFGGSVHEIPVCGTIRKSNSRVHPSASPRAGLSPQDASEITGYIIGLYRCFLAEGKTAECWEQPLLDFMKNMPSI